MGNWQSFIYAISAKSDGLWPPKLSPFGQHIIEIELALKDPTLAWQKGEMARCVDLLEASPVLADYLWPEVLSKLRNATTIEEVTTARLLVMLDIFLSCLACWDTQAKVDGYVERPMFGDIFPGLNAETIKQPNHLFFSWLSEYSGAKRNLSSKIIQVTKPASETSDDSIKRQLRRWKSGKGFPSDDVLDALFRNIYGARVHEKTDANHKHWALCWSMAGATKRINFLMPLLTPLSKITDLVFPFGHTSIQEWRESRYRHWYEHWLPLQEPR